MSLFSIPTTVKRSVTIEEPIDQVWAKVSTFAEMDKWSPWMIMEREAKQTLAGEDGKTGSRQSWDGVITGAGSRTLNIVEEGKRIRCDLEFTKPWPSSAIAYLDLSENNDHTTVTWTLESQLPVFMFWMKSMMETWVGMDYERGLRMLKEYCETGEILSRVQVHAKPIKGSQFHYIGVKNSCSIDEVGPAMAADFEKLEAYVTEQELDIKNPAFSIYHQYDMKNRTCTYTSGVSTPEFMEAPEGFVTGTVDGGAALTVEHTGRYENLGNAWSAGYGYLNNTKTKLRKGSDPLEIYTNHPKLTEPQNLHTILFFPLANQK